MDEMEKEANKKLSILEGNLSTSLQATRVSNEHWCAFISILFVFKDYEIKCRSLEGNVASLNSAIKDKNKEIDILQKDLDLLLATLAKAQSSGLVHLSGMALARDNSQLDQLVVQSQEQVYCSVLFWACFV